MRPGPPCWIVIRVDMYQFGPDDLDDVRRRVEVLNAASATDSPWDHPATLSNEQGFLRFGWDKEPMLAFVAVEDGQTVGLGEYNTSEWDNKHLAWLGVVVAPEHRRRGYGTQILEALMERARGEGRRSVGIDAWDSEVATAFATRHGFERKSQAINRRQTFADVDWAAVERDREQAAAAASAYELVRRTGRTADDELPALATLTASINDAPTDDLDIEDEVFSPERVRDYEEAQVGCRNLLHRVIARHRETGELAGHTVVVVEEDRPWIGHQHDTAVSPKHRGHRLGLLLKAEMMLWLRADQPQVLTVDTWNAESNDHMIGVNKALGYSILGRGLQFQRDL